VLVITTFLETCNPARLGSWLETGVGRQSGNVVRIQPPLVIDDAALDHALDVVDQAMGSVSRS
jgi:4-aminobutyrate aminotransferase-like enzyme